MKTKLSELNNASVIILDAGDFLKIRIDKNENKIIELICNGKEINRDMTKNALDIESNYTLGDMVVDTPYTLGMVTAKLLKGAVNNKCKKILNAFDEIIYSFV